MQAKPYTTVRSAAIAALCIAGCFATAAAQTPSATPGSTPGLQGTGPRVNVQTSPNGTLDVSGTDVNMVGENFRGSFGASRLQPGWSVMPSPPRSSIQVPLAAPNFGPSMLSPAAPGEIRRNQVDAADADTDLILPRFRSALGGNTQRQSVDAWRYRYSGGRWWFRQSTGDWLYWDGARWQAFAARQ